MRLKTMMSKEDVKKALIFFVVCIVLITILLFIQFRNKRDHGYNVPDPNEYYRR